MAYDTKGDWIGLCIKQALEIEDLERAERRGCWTVAIATLVAAVCWWVFIDCW